VAPEGSLWFGGWPGRPQTREQPARSAPERSLWFGSVIRPPARKQPTRLPQRVPVVRGLPFGRQRASSRQGCPRGSLWFGGLPFGRQRASSRQGCPSGDPSGDFFSPSALKGRASGRSCPPTGPPLGKTLIGLRPRSRAQAGGTCVD